MTVILDTPTYSEIRFTPAPNKPFTSIRMSPKDSSADILDLANATIAYLQHPVLPDDLRNAIAQDKNNIPADTQLICISQYDGQSPTWVGISNSMLTTGDLPTVTALYANGRIPEQYFARLDTNTQTIVIPPHGEIPFP